jgi:hypothetical protein
MVKEIPAQKPGETLKKALLAVWAGKLVLLLHA